jgi:amino acid transporter
MSNKQRFGTAPVFFTAISTILGAILFLRFGFAVGTLGFWGVILIIILGHMVTVPTALAISEIATNKRVEGGGEYFIISRSFGLNIGGTIGLALYLSQSISVAFYVIAFTEAFEFFFSYMNDVHNIFLPRQVISVPMMLILSALIIRKGANIGVKALYFVVVILGISLLLFFLGDTGYTSEADFYPYTERLRNMKSFFMVFAIVFPAFTGMTAGVGLSGDLKNPGKSIPLGTVSATIIGMIIYVFIIYKLAVSASPEDLVGHQLIMSKVAVGGAIVIPLGLAASTISSAIGSVMVAPRTLQALSGDKSFPIMGMNRWLKKGREKDNEPVNASIVTCAIAFVFVLLGNLNAVAEIISMFFMLTYGSLCLISFLNHFGSSPSYRPSFKSKWLISLLGCFASVWVMFKINTFYAFIALIIMTVLYLYISSYHQERKGVESLFVNAIFQLNRKLQVFLQKKSTAKTYVEWRPSAICISKYSFARNNAFKLLNWISYKYGFGTYLHRIEGYYSKVNNQQARSDLKKLIKVLDEKDSSVYLDTIISPSYTSAIAHAIQIPGIAGMENNMIIFEYDKETRDELPEIIDNFSLVAAGNFDVCILASGRKEIQNKKGIHIWLRKFDEDNASLMILLSFIILGHPDWRNSNIKIFLISKAEEVEEMKTGIKELVQSGRLPITSKNIEVIIQKEDVATKKIINDYSFDAGITILGFREETLNHEKENMFDGYDELGNILYVNSRRKKVIR